MRQARRQPELPATPGCRARHPASSPPRLGRASASDTHVQPA
uniref:Uncharacterized protein n=1 Tax=Pan troglodytes TaxID=9598 RepID=G2HE29_PANTR|nr:hypothetical protein [Pan troglodytes]